MAEIAAVEVRLWDRSLGAVAPLAGKPGYYEFQFQRDLDPRGFDPSPLLMPARPGRRYSFPNLPSGTFFGLPGLLADALPDRFGNALIDEYLSRSGTPASEVTTLQRLCYVGRRSMGALEFAPALALRSETAAVAPLQMAGLVEDARHALRGHASRVTQDIIDVGSSAGGARAKAVLGWNRQSGEIVSGQFELPTGFEHWLLKFDVGEDKQLGTTRAFGRIEYAHFLLARRAGIEMSECHLLEENGRAHFMTRRWDRAGNVKRHVQSLCALQHLDFNLPYVHGYEQCLRTILALDLGARAIEQAWLRCAFNVAFVNCDDHTKNVAFLMDRNGKWSLAPAYDLCFAYNPAPGRWTRQHQMLVRGKARDITRGDLLELAAQFGVNQPGRLLDRILEVRADWRNEATVVGVPADAIEHIAKLHPNLSAQERAPKA
ncbi:MAG: type II toxin-antitoxin system HipA family toxin [Deltaproteobacteria bacterium]|nr:type II toxin-antitoxin system HipA family toxin [Deltaproteobacteria bacterium]